MTHQWRFIFLVLIDSILVIMVTVLSWALTFVNTDVRTLPFIASLIAILIGYHLFAIPSRLYKKVWEYASIGELLIILKVICYTIITAMVVQLIVMQAIFIRFLAITTVFLILFIGGSRFIWRIYRDTFMNKQTDKLRTLIIGAGSAGTMVARHLLHDEKTALLPVAFVDDDERKQHLDILGLPVVGGIVGVKKIVQEMEIDHIIIAIPSLKHGELDIIFQACAKTKVRTQILPLLEDLITGKVSVNQFRDIEIEDLLAREPVQLDTDSISSYIENKVVLVTGAGGSIGSEIVRQASTFRPKTIILLGHGENSIYTIEQEVKVNFKHSGIQFITEIADIQDAKKMVDVMRRYSPDVIYHAAAHKHVPLMERHPEEAIKNNIIGTMNVASAADKNNVNTFVMISTDKAVNPTSVMGATKKLAEMVIQYMNKNSKTKFVTVRFGNVLGSKGSVIPLFKKQIEKGGPVTITHPDMVRYFMTIPEASKLVIQAGALAKEGEIFVLDMGQPVKIIDLAKKLIHLSGYSIEEIGIEYTGIRPGEKLYEEMLDENEIFQEQLFPKIYMGKMTEIYWEEIERIIFNFQTLDRMTLKEELLNLANNRVLDELEPVYSVQN